MAKRMTPEEKAERAAEREAKAKADRDAYIKKLVDDWPPLTDEQIWKLRQIMQLHRPPGAPRGPSPYELEQQRKLREKEQALADAKKLALSLTACDVCDIQPEQHYYAQKGAIDMHEWQPGRAAKILNKPRRSKTVHVYEHEGVPHVSTVKPAPPKQQRGRPRVDVCKRGHDQTVPGARGVDGRQCLKCRSIIKAANKSKRTEENNG